MEIKELLKALGLPEGTDSVEKAVAEHTKVYLKKETAHEDDDVIKKANGKLFGELSVEAKKVFGFTNSEIEGKHLKEILKMGGEKHASRVKELEDNGSKNTDEQVKTLTIELEKHKTLAAQYKGDLDTANSQKTEIENKHKTEIKGLRIGNILKEAKSKLRFIDNVPEVSKIGFDALINTNYKIDLDEKDNVIVLDSKTNKRISNPSKAGDYLDLDGVLDMELDKAKLKKNNNLPAGHGLPPRKETREIEGTQQNGRVLNKRAVAAAETNQA